MTDFPLIRPFNIFYDGFKYRGYAALPGSETLPDHWQANPITAFTTMGGVSLEILTAGELVYTGSSLNELRIRTSGNANYAIGARVIGDSSVRFEIRGRRKDTDNAIAFFIDISSGVIKLIEYNNGVGTSLDAAVHEFNKSGTRPYLVELVMFENSVFGVIAGKVVVSATSAAFVDQHGFSIYVDEVSDEQTPQISAFQVRETEAYPAEQLTEDLRVLFRRQLKQNIEQPATRNWESFKRAYKLRMKCGDLFYTNDEWAELGLPVKDPTTEDWFTETTL